MADTHAHSRLDLTALHAAHRAVTAEGEMKLGIGDCRVIVEVYLEQVAQKQAAVCADMAEVRRRVDAHVALTRGQQ